MIKGIIDIVKESFRTSKGSVVDMLMDKIDNPVPRNELFPYRYYDRGIYYIEGNIGGFTYECEMLVGIDHSVYKQLEMLFDDQLPEGWE